MGMDNFERPGFREATLGAHDKLQELSAILYELPWERFGHVSLLASNWINGTTSAEALSDCGIIFLDLSLLKYAPPEILNTVLIHEAVHLQVSGILRQILIEEAPELDALFHQQLIPAWLLGDLVMKIDDDYVESSKGWSDLYGYRPATIELDKVKLAIRQYAQLFRNDQIFIKASSIMTLSPAVTPLKQNTEPMANRYAADAANFSLACMTGFRVMEYLRRFAIDMNDMMLEEGLANFISTEITGVSIEHMQRFAPQDIGKIRLAQRIKSGGGTLDRAIRAMRSYDDIRKLYTECGI
jgi:hypothetical protein